ncbi:DNA polymerase III subunit delta' [Lysobacter terrae]
MSANETVRFAPWQQRIYAQAAQALDAGRLGHALLLAGPAQLGKREVAQRLAQRLLCEQRQADGEPCGRCRGCHLLGAGTHPDYQFISFIPNKEGTRLRTEIVIEQIREVSERLSLTPQYGGAQIVILDPAEAINHAASNALLKTLEEPVPGRYLWLVSAHPSRLSATIRSRCQKLEFRLPSPEEALAWLRQHGHAESAAREALEAARGHPGLAHEWLKGNGMALRREIATDLAKLGRGEAGVAEVAQRWSGDEDLELRLRHAADFALAEAGRLTDPAQARRLAEWFDRANQVRDLLRTTVRADLAVVELLLAWNGRGTAARGAGGSRA